MKDDGQQTTNGGRAKGLLTTDYLATDYGASGPKVSLRTTDNGRLTIDRRPLPACVMRDYTKIEAWKLADDLTVAVYQQTRTFPREELYGLTGQLRRAVSSVPANIVEGSARETQRDYLHFLHIARASLSEAQYFLHLTSRLNYLTSGDASRLQQQVKQVFACLHGLTRAVARQAYPATQVVRSPVVRGP